MAPSRVPLSPPCSVALSLCTLTPVQGFRVFLLVSAITHKSFEFNNSMIILLRLQFCDGSMFLMSLVMETILLAISRNWFAMWQVNVYITVAWIWEPLVSDLWFGSYWIGLMVLLCLGVRTSLSRPRHKMGLSSGVSIWEWPVVIGGSDHHVSISYKEITDPFNILTLHEFPEVAF